MSSAAPINPSPTSLSPVELSRIAQDLQIRKVQVESVIQLLAEGNTIPFIARYRRERTLGLEEDVLRVVQDRLQQLRGLADRKQTILKSIETQGKLTEDLKAAITAAETHRRLDDLYVQFRPKKKAHASAAREKGLEPFALAIWTRDPVAQNLTELTATLINPEKQLNAPEDVLNGARQIIAEIIADAAEVRAVIRRLLWESGRLVVTRSEKLPEGKGLEYKDYFQFTEPVGHVPPHRILALNRGERENALSVRLEFDAQAVRKAAEEALVQLADHPHREFLLSALDEAVTHIVLLSLERELRRELTDFAMSHAIAVFARNLRALLMQPPLRGKRVLAIDPGFRSGCRLAALDESGNPLEDAVVFPHAPHDKMAEARQQIERLIRKHQTSVVCIGNGTACRETEEIIAALITEFDVRRNSPTIAPNPEEAIAGSAVEAPQVGELSVHDPVPNVSPETVQTEIVTSGDVNPPIDAPADVPETIAAEVAPTTEAVTASTSPESQAELIYPDPPLDLSYVIVTEAGASDYAASPIGREEFPNLEAGQRGTISIGRRLQDPLSELVKIDPQHVGVGLYQHDVHGKQFRSALEAVVESCVNRVGVDINSASVPLLRHVAGLNQLVAREIVDHRLKNGPFRRREDVEKIPSIGTARYTQAAGFIKITEGDEPLDTTWIHPERYELTRQILGELGHNAADIQDKTRHTAMRDAFNSANVEGLAQKFNIIPPTVFDIFDALAWPGRDPRDDVPPPIFRRDVLRLEDMHPGMELRGTVLNVVDFGAFVDIGLKDSGLVHISQLANRFIRNPHDIVSVGDVVTTWVMTVDNERKRVSLTMIRPGTERKPHEFGPAEGHPSIRTAAADSHQHPTDQGQRGPRPQRRGPKRKGPRQGQATTDAPAPLAASGHAQSVGQKAHFERKSQKPKPLPKLSAEKREGKAYLNTLGELEAFFKARETPPAEPSAKLE